MPLWAIGLVLAGIAPFVVRFIADAFDAHARRRTERQLDQPKTAKRSDAG